MNPLLDNGNVFLDDKCMDREIDMIWDAEELQSESDDDE
jgi:hypothetical protein